MPAYGMISGDEGKIDRICVQMRQQKQGKDGRSEYAHAMGWRDYITERI